MRVNVPLLDLKAQYAAIRDAVLPAVMSVIERQQFIMGPEVEQLEAAVAKLSAVRHAIGCASGTDAVLLPLQALELSPTDEVITPAFTFFATAGTIHNAGGKPVFVDIDEQTQKLAFYRDECEATRAAAAIDVVQTMTVNNDSRIAA